MDVEPPGLVGLFAITNALVTGKTSELQGVGDLLPPPPPGFAGFTAFLLEMGVTLTGDLGFVGVPV
jgi:hypothetical protein